MSFKLSSPSIDEDGKTPHHKPATSDDTIDKAADTSPTEPTSPDHREIDLQDTIPSPDAGFSIFTSSNASETSSPDTSARQSSDKSSQLLFYLHSEPTVSERIAFQEGRRPIDVSEILKRFDDDMK